MIKIYLLAKKIHRVLLYLAIFLIVFMGFTGLILKYTDIVYNFFPQIDSGLMRYLHNEFSIYFSIVLFAMLVTGTFMYVFPLIQARNRSKDSLSTNQPLQ